MKRFSKLYTALILIFLFAPIAVMILFSFNSGHGFADFKGFDLKWYRELFKNSEILNALKNSLILAVTSSVISTIVGTLAAFGIHHMKKKWLKNSIMTATNIPMMNPEIITGISLMFLFVFVGTLLGLTTKLNFVTMLIAHVTFCLPYVILNVLPKFKQMDSALPEAALDLGCTPLQSFFKVQLPCILPGVFTGMIMAFTMSLDDFVISYFTSGVDFVTLPVLIYSMTKKSVKPTIYALSTIIFIIIFVLLMISNREKNTEARLKAELAKEEKRKREAIERSKKTGKPLKIKDVQQKKSHSHRSFSTTKLIAIICVLAILLSIAMVFAVFSNEPIVLNVYNWGEYISDGSEDSYDTNKEFEIYCRDILGLNVKVNYITYTSNEDMYAKLSTGAVSYDIIIPSDYMIARLAEEGMLEELDFSNIPNYNTSIDENFKNLYYDPENKYSVPYTYGMVGIIYDANEVDSLDANINEETGRGTWDMMWNEKYKGQILQFNNSRDAFGTAFYKLGEDVNTTYKAIWDKGLATLQQQKPLLKKLVMDEIFNMMESGEAAVGAYYAGDYLTMADNQASNVDLQFYYPENTNLFIDAMCIPKCTQNKQLAEQYINFMLSDDAAVANAEYICYASPHKNVYTNEQYIEDMGEDAMAILYPDNFDFYKSYQANSYHDLDAATKSYINTLWARYATTQGDNSEGSLEARTIVELSVYGVIIVASVSAVLIRKRIKKSKR